MRLIHSALLVALCSGSSRSTRRSGYEIREELKAWLLCHEREDALTGITMSDHPFVADYALRVSQGMKRKSVLCGPLHSLDFGEDFKSFSA